MRGSRKPEKDSQMSCDDVAIRVEGVSKRFELYDTPRDQLKQFTLPRLQRMAGLESKQYFREFWALKDISFEIKKGESVGVVGRNGSGKSTLLQIIAGTLSPTAGSVAIQGRIAALLELGSGFNPEFTGRENVYMNANLLGLKKKDIDVRFEDIVDFAEIGDFIDQPVKIYSSGMFVRLAFSVIAHVNADILIIDEALAVGDALFTQKCMRFLRDFMETGTVFFVSHDLPSVKNLCERTLWLENGILLKDGDSDKVCNLYYQHTLQGIYGDETQLIPLMNGNISDGVLPSESEFSDEASVGNKSELTVVDNSAFATGWKTGEAEITSITMKSVDKESNNLFEGGERVQVVMCAKAHRVLLNPILGFIVKDHLGQELFGENTLPFTKGNPFPVEGGQELVAEFVFKLPMLQDGQYVIMASFASGDSYKHTHHHYIHDALVINVSCSKIRFGIMDISFESVSLKNKEIGD